MCPSRPESAQRLAHVEKPGFSETVAAGDHTGATRPVHLLVVVEHVEEPAA